MQRLLDVPCASITAVIRSDMLKCLSFPCIDLGVWWKECSFVLFFIFADRPKLLYMLSIILNSLNKKTVDSDSPICVHHNHVYLDYCT